MNKNKKIKVCILQNGLARGGTDTFVINLCRAIDKDKFDITVVNSCLVPEKNVRESDLLETGVQLIYTSDVGLGLKDKIQHLKMLYHILKRGEFDVFPTNVDLFNGPNLFIAWLAGVPIRCCHSHNSMQERELIEGNTLAVCLYQNFMRFLCWHFANRYSGCSEKAMDFLFEGHDWHQDQYPIVVNNGIDIERFRNFKEQDKILKKKELGLTAKYNLLTVGHFSAQKNSVFIADTIGRFLRQRVDCNFVWVGIGPKEDECKRILADYDVLDQIHFLGRRADVNEIMQCCDLFFMPSAFEGLGIVIIEAQAAGLPCIVSDVVPIEANCGACQYVSLNEKKETWIDSINKILDGEKILKVDESKMQKFSIKCMTEQMQQIFQKK